MSDAVRDSHPDATISGEQVDRLRVDWAAGMTLIVLAAKYGLSLSQVQRICART